MSRLPILISRSCVDELVEHIVTHLPAALRSSDAGLLHRLQDHLQRGPIVDSLGEGIESRTLAPQDGCHDAGTSGLAARFGPIPQADVRASGSAQLAIQSGCRAENQSVDDGHLTFDLARLLSLQQRSQLLRFGVSEVIGVIDGLQGPVGLPSPSSGIAPQPPRPTLDLDQEKALAREDQQIDLVDAAVIGDELKVGPRAKRLASRELRPHKFQSITLPGKLGFTDAEPIGACCCHRCSVLRCVRAA